MAGKGVLFAAVATVAIFFATAPVLASDDAWPSQHVASAVDHTVARYGLPGIAVGVLVDGEVRQVEVRGETVAGSGEAIDAATLFKVASNTKAMTGALLARQVDAGLLAWDDPVVKHLPGFRMHEDWVTREMQVRDLLIHNSGLGPGAGDLMLWPEPNTFTRDEVIAGLAHLKPMWSFRSRYAYDNTLYIVAGEVAAAVGGAPYDVLLRREVFGPLGMDGCRVGEWRLDRAGRVAAPHVQRDGRWEARRDGPVVADMPMSAAGGVRCTLDDMLRWARAWLDPATPDGDGRPWLSTAQREAVWTAHMPMPVARRMRDWNRSHYHAYGYGWRLSDVNGTQKVAHTGTLSGMYSALSLLPEEDVGFVILINGDAGEARTVLEQSLTTLLTACPGAKPDPDACMPGGDVLAHGGAGVAGRAGGDPLVRSTPAPGPGGLVGHYAALLAGERAARAPVASAPGDVSEAVPAPEATASRRPVGAASLSGRLGRYRDPWFGEASICRAGDGVRFESHKSPRLSGPVLRAGKRLLVDFDTLGADADAWLDFVEADGADGAVPGLRMAKVDPDADFSYDYEDLAFQRVGDCP